MSAASVCPRSAADHLIRSAVDISHPRQQASPPASSSAASGPVRSDIINGLGAGAVRGGGNSSLVSRMSPGVVPGPVYSPSAPLSSGRGNYCLRKAKHCITVSLRVPWLVVPPLALTVSMRKLMYARML